MLTKSKTQQIWTLDSIYLQDAYTDFILSRKAMMCTPQTIQFYEFTLGKIFAWLENNDVHQPNKITSRHVRELMVDKGYSESFIHNYARVIRAFVRFLFKEKYVLQTVEFEMPKVGKRRLLVYKKDEVQQIINSCQTRRDKAFILLMVDSGLRQAEVISLNWGDGDISSGIVRIENGKGRKARSVVIGAQTRKQKVETGLQLMVCGLGQ